MRNILLLHLVARYKETIDMCIWRMFVFSDCVGVCRNVCYVAGVENSVFRLGLLKYAVCLCKGCDGCSVFCLNCEAWSCRCLYMGSMSVSSSRCCLFVCIL